MADDQTIADRLGGIEHRLDAGDGRMQALEEGQAALKEAQDKNNEMTADIRELMELGRTGFKILNWIGRAFTAVAKWVAPIAAAIAAVYAALYAIKTGHPPPKP